MTSVCLLFTDILILGTIISFLEDGLEISFPTSIKPQKSRIFDILDSISKLFIWLSMLQVTLGIACWYQYL